MKVYQVLEFYAYEGFAEPGDYVYSSREQAEARVEELRREYPGQYNIFELEVK